MQKVQNCKENLLVNHYLKNKIKINHDIFSCIIYNKQTCNPLNIENPLALDENRKFGGGAGYREDNKRKELKKKYKDQNDIVLWQEGINEFLNSFKMQAFLLIDYLKLKTQNLVWKLHFRVFQTMVHIFLYFTFL